MTFPTLYVIDEPESPSGEVHIANAGDLGGGEAITLCGFVDVSHDYAPADAVPTCRDCLTIVAYCKSLRLPK